MKTKITKLLITNMADVKFGFSRSKSPKSTKQRKNSSSKSDLRPDNECEKVPLNTKWTFWTDKTERGISAAQYEASLEKVYTVDTVQSFWSVYNNIPSIPEIKPKYNYHLMRDERRPMWEDEGNCRGGTWRLKCPKIDTHEIWREILLAAIGEQFSDCMAEGDDICGVSVNVRDKDDIVQIWNIDATLAQEAKVLDKVHQLLPHMAFLAEFYKAHYTHVAYEGQKK